MGTQVHRLPSYGTAAPHPGPGADVRVLPTPSYAFGGWVSLRSSGWTLDQTRVMMGPLLVTHVFSQEREVIMMLWVPGQQGPRGPRFHGVYLFLH